MTKKPTYDEVKTYFESQKCTLLSLNYENAKQKLEYICTCGRSAEITFDKFKQGQRCKGCRGDRISRKQRYTLSQVREAFESQGCVLLSKEYENNKQKLRYRCSCGELAFISFSKFNSDQRCKKCKGRKISEKLSAERSPKWNGEKSEAERIRERKFPEYSKWRRSVYERDDFTCQICGSRGVTLNAHHIQSYAKFPDLRTDIDNGITLCETCHRTYHRTVEQRTATKEGWEFYMHEVIEPWYAGEVLHI